MEFQLQDPCKQGRALQRFWLALPYRGFVTLLGGYYTIAHALCTALVLVFLYRSNRSRYAFALGTIATSCVVALVCFRFFPTMPPRLLALHDSSFVMTDVLSEVSTSAPSAELLRMSNQYAAIPSMHCAWAFFTVRMPLATERTNPGNRSGPKSISAAKSRTTTSPALMNKNGISYLVLSSLGVASYKIGDAMKSEE